MTKEFEMTEPAIEIMDTLGTSFEDAAFKQAGEFISVGQTAREATSIVAHLMVRAAWIAAGCAAASEGLVPNRDNFRRMVETVLGEIEFTVAEVDKTEA